MSHVALVETKVDDLECLAKAAEACGLKFVQGQKTFKWYGRWMNDYSQDDAAYLHGIKPEDYGKCEHAIVVPGNKNAYEVGVVPNPNGEGYVLLWDFYAGGHGLQKHLGGPSDCNKLMDQYAKFVTIKQAESMGMTWNEEFNEETGEIILTLNDYS